MIGCNALQPANRDRLVLDAPATTGRLAGTVADAAEYAGKDIGFPIEHVCIAELALGDEPYISGNIRVSRTCPLAIDDFVEIIGP